MHYILTQYPVTIDLSPPAVATIMHAIETREPLPLRAEVQCEIDNFCNLLQNLLERTEHGNLDLIGE